MRTHRLVRAMFVASVWLLIGISAWQFWQFLFQPENYRSVPAGFQARVFMGPLVLMGMELLFWFRFFAHEREGARVFAAMMAFFMLTLLLVSMLSDLPDGTIGQRYFWAYAFIGAAHLLYAVCGREQRW